MKILNLKFYVIFIIFFGITYNVNSQTASQENDMAWSNISDGKPGIWNKTGKQVSCDVKFADLNYVGVQFVGKATCVIAENDAAAKNACNNKGRVINPGNPQYQSSIAGTRGTNPKGYYYCVGTDIRNDKRYACDTIAPNESIYKREEGQIEFKWVAASKGTDGDCRCGLKGAPELGFRDCDQGLPRFPDMCAPLGLAKASDEEFMEMTLKQDPKASASCGPMACKCSDGRVFDVRIAKDQCAKPAEEPQPQRVSGTVAAPTAPIEDTLDATLKQCVDDWKVAANKCKTVSDEAKNVCGSADDKKNSETSQVLDAASNAYIGSKSGTGAQQECFKGGLIANYTKDLLSKKSDECTTKTDLCTAACKPEEVNKEKNRCHNILQGVIQQRYGGDNPPENKNSQYFSEGDNFANQLMSQGTNVCGEVSTKDKSMIGSALESVGKSLASSVTCMCKLSSGGTGPCDEIVPPSSCEANPSLPGCRQYGAIGVCTPGSSYDAKLCSCQLNPKGAGCPGGSSSGGLSNFASGGNISNGTNGPDIGTPISNLQASGVDSALPGNADEAAGNLKLEPSKGGNAAAGGPGGGSSGGGASSGGAAGDGAPEEEEEKSGIGGLFGAAKSFVSKALGGSKNKGNGNLNDAKKKFDANKFRPIRGVASKSGVGSKNQDIWKMVNTCLYSETCASNSNSFLESPLKHK